MQFTAKDIAGVREAFESTLTRTAQVLRNYPQGDGAGGDTDNWTNVENGSYSCRISPMRSPSEQSIGGSIVGVGNVKIALPYNAAVIRQDRLVIDGRTYEVIGIIPEDAEVGLFVECVELA